MRSRPGAVTIGGMVCLLVLGPAGCGDQTASQEPARKTAVPVEGRHILIENPEPACPTCEIRLRPLGVLGSHDDARLLRQFPEQIVRDSRGQVYAVVPLRDHEVLV
jgi:hypothetical protein